MALKKCNFSSIWASCDELRGGMDASQYKDYVLFDEVADPKHDFHLNLPRYIDASAPEDIHDIDGNLRGAIRERNLDALADYWRSFADESAVMKAEFGQAAPGDQEMLTGWTRLV